MKPTSKWKTVIAVISAILFGFTLTFSLFAYNIERQMFNPAVYKESLSIQNVCTRLPSVLAHQLTSTSQSQDRNTFYGLLMGSIDPERLQNLIEMVLPCQVVEKVVFGGIDLVFARINNSTGQQGFSLNPIKQSIEANSATAMDELLKSQPDCSTAELLKIGTDALFGQSDNNSTMLCNPPDALREVFTVPLKLMLNSVIQELPESIPLSSGLGRIIDLMRTTRTVMNWSPLIPFFFLGLTTALVVRSWRSLFRWWGFPLLASGVLALVISLFVSPMVYALLRYLVLPNLPVNMVPEAIKLISDVFSTVTLGLARPIQIQSAVISFAGLAMVIGEKLSRPKN